MSRTQLSVSLIGIVLALLLGACAPAATPEPTAVPTSAAQPAPTAVPPTATASPTPAASQQPVSEALTAAEVVVFNFDPQEVFYEVWDEPLRWAAIRSTVHRWSCRSWRCETGSRLLEVGTRSYGGCTHV